MLISAKFDLEIYIECYIIVTRIPSLSYISPLLIRKIIVCTMSIVK